MLNHDQVVKLMFVHMNLKLRHVINICEEDFDFSSSVAAGDGEGGGATHSQGEVVRSLDAS